MAQLPVAVLWDMDGTLVETEPVWGESEHALVEEFGGTWTDADAVALIGTPLPEAARILRSRGVDLPTDRLIQRLMGHVVDQVRAGRVEWRPGAVELLDALVAAGVPCALVTMSFRELAEAVLGNLPTGMFDVVVTGDEVVHGKPHPEPYLRAARALGVDPASAVAIEDSPTGVLSAQAAGVPVVAVQNIAPIHAAPGRLVLRSLAGVTPEDLAGMAGEIRSGSGVPG